MMNFSLSELKNESFYCEHFLESKANTLLVQRFSVKNPSGKNLALFLKELAAQNEIDNENRTYLVKDRTTGEVAGYFALRNGLFTIQPGDDMLTIPAIELSNFAVNETYRQNHPDVSKIGRTIFYDFVLPLARYIQTLTAVKAIYIYALPENRLIEHYCSLGFTSLSEEDLQFIYDRVKPAYDDGCVFMYQIL